MNGAELIAAERQRQIEVEGWTFEHDDEHNRGELIEAAACYIEESLGSQGGVSNVRADWPWDEEWWKPGDPIPNLVKAGALIAAEIDRLGRKS